MILIPYNPIYFKIIELIVLENLNNQVSDSRNILGTREINLCYISLMKTIKYSCDDCGEDEDILIQVSCTLEVIYLCNDCYKNRYSKHVREEIEKQSYVVPRFIQN